jgi:hypothetical protein
MPQGMETGAGKLYFAKRAYSKLTFLKGKDKLYFNRKKVAITSFCWHRYC